MMKFEKNDAPILIVLGQSNGIAANTHLREDEIIRTPLKNVHGLSREFNQAYGLDDVTWSGFTTNGMNLGEDNDDTLCIPNLFAARWQRAIDNGAELPDLYVISIVVCAQGVAQFEVNGWNMWYALREPIIKPGNANTCDISLYPLTTEILSLATMNLIAAGKRPKVIGLHWNQWETECSTGSRAMNEAKANYENLFWGFFTALGSDKTGKGIPLYLYRALSETFEQSRLERMNEIFEGFTQAYADCRILDLREAPFYNDTPKLHGIFQGDAIHYNDEAHRWFAERQWSDLFD